MPGDRLRGGGGFPLKLRGEPFTRPLRICRGLIKADMGDGLVRIELLDAVERKYSPVAVVILEPIQRRPPALGARGRPAVRKPEQRPIITTFFDEAEIFAAGYGTRGEAIWREKHLVPRPLVVIGEGVAIVADRHGAAAKINPAHRRHRMNGGDRGRGVTREHWVTEESMLDVGKNQFLMLLLMIEAQINQRRYGGPRGVVRCLEEIGYRFIDVAPVSYHLGDGRPRYQASLGSGMARPERVVIGIKQERIATVNGLIACIETLQDEGLEKPRGMAEVPFRGTGVGHRLHTLVLGAKARGELLGKTTDRGIVLQERRPGVMRVIGNLAWHRNSPSLTLTKRIVDLAGALRLWTLGQLMEMTLVGVTVGVAVWLVGLPSPYALGAIACVAQFVPYIGPIIAMIPSVLVATTVSWTALAWTIAAYLLIHQLDGYVVMPIIQQRLVSVPPALMLLSIVALGEAFGATATVFAAPITVLLYVLVTKLYVRDTLHEEVAVPGEADAQAQK